MTKKYYFYNDAALQNRWRYKNNNGRIIAGSAEVYIHKSDCQYGIDIMKNSSGSTVED